MAPADVRYGDWSARGAESLVIGAVTPAADGRYEVHFRLMDVLKQTQLAGFSYTITPAQTRITAHRIASMAVRRERPTWESLRPDANTGGAERPGPSARSRDRGRPDLRGLEPSRRELSGEPDPRRGTA